MILKVLLSHKPSQCALIWVGRNAVHTLFSSVLSSWGWHSRVGGGDTKAFVVFFSWGLVGCWMSHYLSIGSHTTSLPMHWASFSCGIRSWESLNPQWKVMICNNGGIWTPRQACCGQNWFFLLMVCKLCYSCSSFVVGALTSPVGTQGHGNLCVPVLCQVSCQSSANPSNQRFKYLDWLSR